MPGDCNVQSELDSFIGQYFHSMISLAVHLDAMKYTHIQTNIQSLILVRWVGVGPRGGAGKGKGGIRGK